MTRLPWLLGFRIAAALLGGYLGFIVGENRNVTGIESLNVLIGVGLVIAIVAVLLIGAGILALDARGRPLARTLVGLALLVVVGAAGGWLIAGP